MKDIQTNEPLFSINPDEIEGDLFKITPEGVSNAIHKLVARDIGEKTKLAFPEEFPKGEYFTQMLERGEDGGVRDNLVQWRMAEAERTRADVLKAVEENIRLATPEDITMLGSILDSPLYPDESSIVVEKQIAEKLSDAVAGRLAGKGKIAGAERADETFDVLEDIFTKQEIVRRKLGEAAKRYETETTTVGNVVDFLKFLIPGYNYYKAAQVAGDKTSIAQFSGSVLDDTYKELLLLPAEEFEKQVTERFEELWEDNPQYATIWLQGLLGYTTKNKFIDNLFDLVDAASIGFSAGVSGVGKGLVTKAKGALKKTTNLTEADTVVRNAAKDAIKANAKSHTADDVAESLAESGAVKESAIIRLMDELYKPRKQVEQELIDELKRFHPKPDNSLFDPDVVLKGFEKTKLGENYYRYLKRWLHDNAAMLTDILNPRTTVKIERIPIESERMKWLLDRAESWFRERNLGNKDAVLDSRVINNHDTPDNITKIEFTLGDFRTLNPFETETEAHRVAKMHYKLPSNSYKVEPVGDNYVIKVRQDIDEFDSLSKVVPLERESQFKPQSPIGAIVKRIVAADFSLGKNTMTARNIATYSSQKALDMVHNTLRPLLRELKGDSVEALKRFMDENLRAYNPKTKLPGRWFDNVLDFTNAWQKMFGRLPKEEEVKFYFTMRQIMEFDYLVRNNSLRTSLTQAGVKQVEIPNAINKGEHLRFWGKEEKDLPWNSKEEAFILKYDKRTGESSILKKNEIDETLRKELKDAISKGKLRVIRVASAGERQLAPIAGDTPVHFVLIPGRDYRIGPLPDIVLNYLPGGGHLIYSADFFTKLPLIRKTKSGAIEFLGEVTVATHGSRREAQMFAKKLSEVLQYAKRKDWKKVEEFVKKEAFPWSVAQIRDFMERYHNVHPKAFDIGSTENLAKRFENELPEGSKMVNLYDSPWDLTDGAFVKFATDRDNLIPHITVEEAEGRLPVFREHAAQLIDPAHSLAGTILDDVQMLWIKDYKAKTAMDFVKQYGDLLENWNPERKNIFEVIHNPVWRKDAPADQLAIAKRAYLTLTNLWRMPDYMDTLEAIMKERMLNFMHKKFGNKGVEWVHSNVIPLIRDPISAVKAMAFHLYLGLFNVKQLFQQSMGVVNVLAFGSVKDWPAVATYTPLIVWRQYGIADEVLVKHLRKLQKRLKDSQRYDLEELYKTFNDSGFGYLVTDLAEMDVILGNPRAITFNNKITEWGLMPFRAGERITRAAAWVAAYREWKRANNFRKVDVNGMQWILNRAHELNARMSTSSRNVLQEHSGSVIKALATLPLQFWTYTQRVMEQMLEAAFKDQKQFAQAFLTYSAFFGIPGGIAATTGFPVYEHFRKWLLEQEAKGQYGISQMVPQEWIDFLKDTAAGRITTEGLLDIAVEKATGVDTNVSEMYGLNGFQFWNPLMNLIYYGNLSERDSEEVVRLLLGASGNAMVAAVKTGGLIWKNLQRMFQGDLDAIAATPDELLEVSRLFRATDPLIKYWIAYNYQKYATARGYMRIEDGEKWNKFLFVLGVQPQEVRDAYLKFAYVRDRERLKQAIADELRRSIRFYLDAVDNGQERIARSYELQIALIMQGLNEYEKAQLWASVIMENKDTIQRAHMKFIQSIMKQPKE